MMNADRRSIPTPGVCPEKKRETFERLCWDFDGNTYHLSMNQKSRSMEATVFNQAQMQLLDLMSFVKLPEALDRLNKAISDYFAREAQKAIDRLWESGDLNEDKIEGFRRLHERKSGIEKALDDVKAGRVYEAKGIKDLFGQLDR